MTVPELTRLLLAIPLLAWLPGALVWRVVDGGVRPRSSEQLLLEVLSALALTTSLATALAELSIFSLLTLTVAWAGLCLTLAWAVWKSRRGREERQEGSPQSRPPVPDSKIIFHFRPSTSTLWTIALLAVLVLAGALFLHPAEALLVSDDAGVYVIHGLTLARTGGLDIRDPLLPSLDSAKAQPILPFLRYESSYIRHEGFYIWHWGRGLVRPSFFHLPSIWMAVLAVIAGPRAAIWATPLAGLLAVGGLALLSRRLFGPAVGLAAALLLTLSFPQVWYARYPASEMFMQAWLVGGLFLLAVFLEPLGGRHPEPYLEPVEGLVVPHRQRLVGIAAGITLGQLFLIRVDAWVAMVALGVCYAGWYLKDQRNPQPSRRDVGDRWFLVPLSMTLAWAGLHAALFASSYVISLTHMYLTPRLEAIAILGAAIVGAIAFVIWSRPTAISLAVPKSGVSRWVAGSIMAGIWALVLVVGTRASIGIEAFEWLIWYFTPLGLAAALVGSVLMLRHGISRPAQVLLLIALMYALLYLPDPRANPTQPWGIRRFVPAVLPGLVVLMAHFAARFPVPGPDRLGRVIRIGLVLILAVAVGQSVRPVLAHHEDAGVWDQVETLAGKFEPGAVVLFNQTGVGQAVGQPLTYLYHRPAFVLQDESLNPQTISELVDQWTVDGRPVYLAITGLSPWLADLDVGLEPAGDFTFEFPRLERPTTHAPRQPYTVTWPIDLYRVTPGDHKPSISRLEMGPGELPYLRHGFYNRETTPDGTTFRWTDGAARTSLPVSPRVTGLTLRVSGPPAGIPPPDLTLFVDGQQVGTWKLPDRFIVLSADVPAGAAADGRLEIQLQSDTWVPRQAGRGDDDRHLGIVVDWIAFQ